MGALARLLSKRNTGTNPPSTLRDPASWFRNWLINWGEPESEIPTTPKAALGVPAWFACIRNIAEDTAKLPLKVLEHQEPRGSKERYDHPAWRLLHDEPNPEMSAMTFRETIVSHSLAYDGGYAEIKRNPQTGDPIALWPLDPTTTYPRRLPITNELVYQSGSFTFPARDVFHLHGLGFTGITGYMMSALMRDTLAQSKGAQKFSAAWFKNGAQPSFAVRYPKTLSADAHKNLRESLNARHGGGDNVGKIMVLESGLEVVDVPSTSPVDSQLIEVLLYSVVEVCRLFRMPPHKIQHLNNATFSNISAQSVEYVTDTLLSHVVRFEQECNRKLLRPSEKQSGRIYCKHNLRALLRGDLQQQAQYFREGLQNGWLSANDAREFDELNPIDNEGGNTYFVQGQMVPIEIAAKGPVKPEAQTPFQDKPDAEDDAPDDTDDDMPDEGESDRADAARRAHIEVLDVALGKSARVLQERWEKAQKRVIQEDWFDKASAEHVGYTADLIRPALRSYARVFTELVLRRVYGPDLAAKVDDGISDVARAYTASLIASLTDPGGEDGAETWLYYIEQVVETALAKQPEIVLCIEP